MKQKRHVNFIFLQGKEGEIDKIFIATKFQQPISHRYTCSEFYTSHTLSTKPRTLSTKHCLFIATAQLLYLSVSLEGPRRSLITAPRFANISENSEEDDAVVTSPSRKRSIQKRSGGRVNDSTLEDIRQKPMKKTFEIVDSDDEDDEDDAIVSLPRRSLDTGFSPQRPSLRQSSQPLSSSASSQREVLGSSRDEALQRPGLSLSKRPLSGKRPSLDRSGGGDSGEARNFLSSSVRKSSLPMGSEEESDDDDVVVTGRKTKNDKKPARSSLTQKSSASTRK